MIAGGTRIPMTEQENQAVNRLLEQKEDGVPVSLMRNDPNESGPVRVEVGDTVYLVDPDGHTEKVTG